MTRSRLSRTLLRGTVPAAVLALGLAFAGPASADTTAFNAYDQNADGYIDAYGFDTNYDGYEDTWAFDLNENGYAEQIAADTNYDGYADTWAFDSNEDGYVDTVGVDTNGDAVPDVWGVDENYDGYADTMYYDVNYDGYADYSVSADQSAYAYASVSYVFVEADGWVYWQVGYEYGSSGLQADGTQNGTFDSLAGEPAAATGTPQNGSVLAEDALHALFPAAF